MEKGEWQAVQGQGSAPTGKPLRFPLQKSYEVPVDLCRDFHHLSWADTGTLTPQTPQPSHLSKRPSGWDGSGVQLGLVPITPPITWSVLGKSLGLRLLGDWATPIPGWEWWGSYAWNPQGTSQAPENAS